jgi:Tfp pilus assembly protein PilO
MRVLKGDLKTQLNWCRRAQWGLLAGLILPGFGVYCVLIRPENAALDTARARLTLAQSELARDQVQVQNLPRVELEIEQLRHRVERDHKLLPSHQDLAEFVDDVTRISKEASLQKLSWHLDSQPKQTNQMALLPVQLSFEGDFQTGVLAFLKATEDMARLTRVRKLDLQTSAGDGQVKAQVVVDIYSGGQ